MQETVKEEIIRFNWNKICWTIFALFTPLSIHYLYSYVSRIRRERKHRHAMQGKVVLITGASSGLGESMAHTFYNAGCKVILAARRTDELERVRNDLLQSYVLVPTHPPVVKSLDLADLPSLPNKIGDILEIFGHIDILINNGGISTRSDVASSSVDIDIKVMLINYFGSVALTKTTLPSMIKRKQGKIVFISSVQGKIALPYRSAYSASKHAIQAFSDSLRAEVNAHNIKVLCVSPGYVNTPLSKNALTANGTAHGKVDPETANGMSSEQMSEQIFKSVLHNDKDVVISSFLPKMAYWIRFLNPSLYFWIMERRAIKMAKDMSAQGSQPN